MPYLKYTSTRDGKKVYCLKNIKTGNITHFKSEEARETGIRMREMYSHGFRPKGLAAASKSTRTRVARMGGRAK